MVNVTIYSIHGSYGLYNPHNNHHYNHEISLYMGLLENSVARMPYWFITIVPTISWLFRVFPIFRQTHIYIYINIIYIYTYYREIVWQKFNDLTSWRHWNDDECIGENGRMTTTFRWVNCDDSTRYSCPGLQNNKNNILQFGDTTVSYDSAQSGRNHGNITSCKMVDLLFLIGRYDWEAFLASGW